MKLTALVFALLLQAGGFPSPTGYVNDYAGVLSAPDKTRIEIRLSEYEKATSNEIAVAIVSSLEGRQASEYANRMFEAWGIGKKNKDNGVLILVAPKEHKAWIEVGYGLEGDLTDIETKHILVDVVPLFKQQKWAEATSGIISGITKQIGDVPAVALTPEQKAERARAVLAKAKREREEAARKKQLAHERAAFAGKIFLGFIGLVVLSVFAGYLSRKRRRIEIRRAMRACSERVRKALADYLGVAGTIDHGDPVVAARLDNLIAAANSDAAVTLRNLDRLVADLDKLSIAATAEAEGLLREARETADAQTTSLNRGEPRLTSIQSDVDSERAQAAGILENLTGALAHLKSSRKNLEEAGFRLGLDREFKSAEGNVQHMETLLTSRSTDPRTATKQIEFVGSIITRLTDRLRTISSMHERMKAARTNAVRESETLAAEMNKMNGDLGFLDENHKDAGWTSLRQAFMDLGSTLSSAIGAIAEAERLSSHEVQDYTRAEQAELRSGQLFTDIRTTMNEVRRLATSVRNAMEDMPAMKRKAEAAFSAARSECDRSYSGSASKETLRKAEAKLKEAGAVSLNWPLAASLFAEAQRLAEQAESEASGARRRHEEEEEESRSYSSSYSSSSSSYDSGGSSFGGFGGGSSGGGGAGVSW